MVAVDTTGTKLVNKDGQFRLYIGQCVSHFHGVIDFNSDSIAANHKYSQHNNKCLLYHFYGNSNLYIVYNYFQN